MIKKITTADGTIMYTLHGKLHSLTGPALIPQGLNRKREYYINGNPMTEKQWTDSKRAQKGTQMPKNI